MRKLIVIMSAIAVAVGCSKSSDDHTPQAASERIGFGVGIANSTRALVESDASELPLADVAGIQVLRGTDGAMSGAAFNTVASVTSTASIAAGTDVMTLATPQYFNAAHDNANFVAFYPAPTTFAAGRADYTIDGTQDIMTAAPQTAVYGVNDEVDFYFRHQLAWVELKVIAEDAAAATTFGNLTASSITVPNQMELTIGADGTTSLAKKASSTNMTLDYGGLTLDTTGAVTDKKFMIFPASADLTVVNLTFANKAAQDYSLTGINLQAGKKSIIVATVKANSIDFTVSVADWEAGNGAGDNIDID